MTRAEDERLLRLAFAVAERSREGGNHPFGSILVDPNGAVLLEVGNRVASDGGDRTAHAERLLAAQAKVFDQTLLAQCTIYSSAEPCAMCAGAIYWSGIGRLVYGQSEADLKRVTGNHPENPTLDLPCRVVFASGQRQVEVVGPLLEDEAAALQERFWRDR